MQVAFVGVITCTIFLRTRLHPVDEQNGNLYLSCLFYGLVHMLFNGFTELPITITRLPVFYKQRDNFFHPAWAFSIPNWILRIPYSLIEAVVWSCAVYYTVGFAPTADRYQQTLLYLEVESLMLYLDCQNDANYVQVLSLYAIAVLCPSNGFGPFPDDGGCSTRHDCC